MAFVVSLAAFQLSYVEFLHVFVWSPLLQKIVNSDIFV